MLNYATAALLLASLPLIKPKLSKEEYRFLNYKWGGNDGVWHSVKATIKETGIVVGLLQAEALEKKAIKLIQNKKAEIFTCPSCDSDVRKSGVDKTVEGLEFSKIFSDDDGEESREIDKSFRGGKIKTYSCLACGFKIEIDSPIGYALTVGLKYGEVIKKFIDKYMDKEGNILHPKVKKGARGRHNYDDLIPFFDAQDVPYPEQEAAQPLVRRNNDIDDNDIGVAQQPNNQAEAIVNRWEAVYDVVHDDEQIH